MPGGESLTNDICGGTSWNWLGSPSLSAMAGIRFQPLQVSTGQRALRMTSLVSAQGRWAAKRGACV